MNVFYLLVLTLVTVAFLIFLIVTHSQYMEYKKHIDDQTKIYFESLITKYSDKHKIDVYEDHITIGSERKEK
jgi:hypothetical protein